MKSQTERIKNLKLELAALRAVVAKFPRFADAGEVITPDAKCWCYDPDDDPPIECHSGRVAIICRRHKWYSTRAAARDAAEAASKGKP